MNKCEDNNMTEEEKMKMLQALVGGGAKIGQFFMDNHGTVTYNDYGEGAREVADKDAQARARDTIMEYVGRLKPLVAEPMQAGYERLWESVLELQEVRLRVYDRGRQQGTTFNRDLVAQIVHQMGTRVYVPSARAAQMAECLEPSKGKDHPVRQRLGESPEGPVKKAVEQLLLEVAKMKET